MHHKNKGLFRALSYVLVACTTITMQPQISTGLNLQEKQTKIHASTSSITTKNANTFSWDNANVYFLLTDRFENGDTSNDHSYGRGLDQNGNILNYSDNGATFHGGDFSGITKKINEGYFNKLGVNAIWISAPYEQIHGYVIGGDSDESFAHYAYHGYYALDYTKTDKNFGTKEEFQTLVDTAHQNGIRVVLDIVMNHSGYNTMEDMNEYNFGTLLDGWQDAYYRSSGINNKTYHGKIDYESSESDWAKWWGPDWIRCGVAGYSKGGGSSQTMSLCGLPDFKTEKKDTLSLPPILKTKWQKEGRYEQETAALQSYLSAHNMNMSITNCLTYWLQSWVKNYGVDGFRCDTAKHVDLASWKTLKTACVEALRDWKNNNPEKTLDDSDFWMTGEVWDHGAYKDDYYTKGGFDSIINFSTQGGGLITKEKVSSIYQGFADSINSDPDFNVLSYISSHDSVLARGNSIYLGSAFLLLPGGIQIFYGDETDRQLDASASANGQHNLRCDMNWDSINEETLTHWQKVSTFRQNHIAVGAGQNESLTATNGVAFSRTYQNTSKNISDKIAAVIGCDANTDITIDVSSLWNDGATVINAYDFTSTLVKNGKVIFNSGSNGTILMEDPDGKPLVTVEGNYEFENTQNVTLHLIDSDYAKISVDGAKKFIAHDGDSFEIGATAYNDDTVKVSVEASNTVGIRHAVYSFHKVASVTPPTDGTPTVIPTAIPTTIPTVEPTTTPTVIPTVVPTVTAPTPTSIAPTETPEVKTDIVYVKCNFTPYVYAWKGNNTALCGSWPGTKLTQKTADGYYKIDLNSLDSYNVVLHNGNGSQTQDITDLKGGVWIDVKDNMSYSIIKTDTTTTTPITGADKLYISSDFDPYVYAWKGTNTALCGSWPGTKLTQKTDAGYYELDLKSSDTYHIVLHDGNGNKTCDITGLNGKVTVHLNQDLSYHIEKNVIPTVIPTNLPTKIPTTAPTVGPTTIPTVTPTIIPPTTTPKTNTFTFNVHTTGTAPTLYIWDSEQDYTGGFPGTVMTEKTENGYKMEIESESSSVNCIISYGNSSTQSSDITGITGSVTIEIEPDTCKNAKVEKSVPELSYFSRLKAATRAIKNMIPENFTTESFQNLTAYVQPSDTLIALGEETADKAAVKKMLDDITDATTALQIKVPFIVPCKSGNKFISGTAAYESKLTITINGKTYKTIADDITGEWSICTNPLCINDTIQISCSLAPYQTTSTTIQVYS